MEAGFVFEAVDSFRQSRLAVFDAKGLNGGTAGEKLNFVIKVIAEFDEPLEGFFPVFSDGEAPHQENHQQPRDADQENHGWYNLTEMPIFARFFQRADEVGP